MSSQLQFYPDDFYLVGNIAARAVVSGCDDGVVEMYEFLQVEQPENAGNFMLESLHYYSKQDLPSAISSIEKTDLALAEVNRDEAFSFYLILLKESGEFEIVRELANNYLEHFKDISEAARHAIRVTLNEIAEKEAELMQEGMRA